MFVRVGCRGERENCEHMLICSQLCFIIKHRDEVKDAGGGRLFMRRGELGLLSTNFLPSKSSNK